MASVRFTPLILSSLAGALALTSCTRFLPDKSYELEIEGHEAQSLRSDLMALISSQEAPTLETPNRELLHLYARGDEKNMSAFMRAEGFYDAHISHTIKGDTFPITAYHVTSGPGYRLDQPRLVWETPDEDARSSVGRHLKKNSGDLIASSRNILRLGESITRHLNEAGYPEANTVVSEVVVDHATTNAAVTLEVNPGVRGRFGVLRVDESKLKRIDKDYFGKAQSWTNREPYDIRTVEEFERLLAASGLFSSIMIKTVPATPAPDDRPSVEDRMYDIELTLSERKPRTLQLGVGYMSDIGAESSIQWQHRNLFGQGENLTLRGSINEEGFEAETRYTIPFLFRHDQRWVNSLLAREEETDAYVTRGVEASSRIVRQFHRDLEASLGLGLYYLRERQAGEEDHFLLVSSPFELDWDRTDDPLDARKGHRLLLETEPFQGLRDPDLFFWKNLVTARGFIPLKRNRSLALAGRITTGYITGDSLGEIPAETRFYAGGGQSVRGYAYQSLSPRENNEVIGGMSLLESSFELRIRAGKKLGFVLFMDGGSAYEKEIGRGSEEYRWGAGAGLRYFTPVGPLRADAGFPLERREGIDDAWQFYISIGQAF